MEKTKHKVSNQMVIVRYLKERLVNGIADGIAEDDYLKLANELIISMNNQSKHSNIEYYVEQENFENICKKAVEITMPLKKQTLKFEDDKLFATYEFSPYYVDRIDDNYLLDNFLYDYVKSLTKKEAEISQYDLSKVTPETLNVSKQISAYIINDLVGRYIKKMREGERWPIQCDDLKKYIFDIDLGSIIGLECTRQTFIDLYNHSIRCVAEMLMNNPNFQLSNNKKKYLAYTNFAKITAPFRSLSHYSYSEYELMNTEIVIKVVDGKANLSETKCTFSDSYGDWSDDIESKQSTLTTDPVQILEKNMGIAS